MSNFAAAAARENAREPNGQFGEQFHTPPAPGTATLQLRQFDPVVVGTEVVPNPVYDELPDWPAGVPEPVIEAGFADYGTDTFVSVTIGDDTVIYTTGHDGDVTTDDDTPLREAGYSDDQINTINDWGYIQASRANEYLQTVAVGYAARYEDTVTNILRRGERPLTAKEYRDNETAVHITRLCQENELESLQPMLLEALRCNDLTNDDLERLDAEQLYTAYENLVASLRGRA